VWTVDCAEIRDTLLSGGEPTGSVVREHLDRCATCRELLSGDAEVRRALARAGDDPLGSADELLARVRTDLESETGFRALVRSLSTRRRLAFGCLAVAFSAMLTLAFARRPSWPTDTLVHFAGVLLVLALGAVLCIREGLSPLSRVRSTVRTMVLGSAALALPIILAAWAPADFELDNPARVVTGALGCFVLGAAMSAPLVTLLWLGDRSPRFRWRVFLPIAAASGLSANLALGLHCPSTEPAHLLLGHATVGVAWLLALWASARVTSA
jgi:hypothetical protein